MNRKLLGGLLALVAVGALVWLLVLRGRGEEKQAAAPTPTRSGQVEAKKADPWTAEQEPKAPTGVAPRWALDVDREGPLVLEGQVQGPDGAGVPDATVWLSSVPPRSTKTEADGTFSFEKLVGRAYSLTASNGALVGGPVQYKLTEKSDPVVIRLGEGATVVVTVTGIDDKPVAGATVKESANVTAKTDEKGIATVKPVRPGWVGVQVSADGYAVETGYTTIGSAGATGAIAVKLRKGYMVSGKVVDDRGKPIAKANVTTRGAANWVFGAGADDEGAVTDDAGAFTVGPLPAGTHTLAAADGEHAPAVSAPITISDGAITGITIVMQPGGTLAGTVVDAQQKPVPFATIRVAGKEQNSWGETARQATSDKDGAFELRGLARTKLQARAESDTAASKIADVDLTTRAEQRDLQLVLDVTGKISGKVVDDKGAPVAEVQVNAFPDVFAGGSVEGIGLAGMSSATTAGDGTFTVHGLPDGQYRLWAARSSANMWQEWGQHGASAKTGDTGVKIVLPTPGGVKGKLAMDGGETKFGAAFAQLGTQTPSPIAPDGTFELRDITPGTYDLHVRGPQFAEQVQRNIKVSSGSTTDIGTLTVMRGRRLTGKVVDKNGPVGGARVKLGEMLFAAEGNESQQENLENLYGIRSAVTDQSGTFTIIGVPPTKAVNVVAEHSDRGRSVGMQIPPGAEDAGPVTLTLRGFGAVTGKVTSKDKPVPNVTVSASPKGGGATAVFAQTNQDGTFSFSKISEGTVVVSAMQQQMMSMRSNSSIVEVVAGRSVNVNIDIPVGSIKLSVQIKPAGSAQIDSAQVFLFRGNVTYANGKQLTDAFMDGATQGMKFWMGGSMPMPQFEELVAGDYTACTIPITGSLSDSTFQQRLQEHMAELRVYCKNVKVKDSPNEQVMVHEVPGMTPLPAE